MVTSISPPSLQLPTKTLAPLHPSPTTGAGHSTTANTLLTKTLAPLHPSPTTGAGYSTTANTLQVVAIVLGVTFSLVVTLIITGIIITFKSVFRVRSRKQAASNHASGNEDVNANTPICRQGDHEHTRYDGGGTNNLQHNCNGSGYQSEDNVVTEAPGVVSMDSMELPPPLYDTISTIDEMELPNDSQMNSNGVLCYIPYVT